MKDFEPIEKELSELKARFANVVETFETLSNAQGLYEQLLALQQELQRNISKAQTVLGQDASLQSQKLNQLHQALQKESKTQYQQLHDEIQNLRREQELFFSDCTHDLDNKSTEIRRIESSLTDSFNQLPSLDNLAWIKPEINSIRKLIYNNQMFVQSMEAAIKRQKLLSTIFAVMSILSFAICIILLFKN